MTNKAETSATQIPQPHPALWSIMNMLTKVWLEFRDYEKSLSEDDEFCASARSDLNISIRDAIAIAGTLINEHLEIEIKSSHE